MLSNLNIRLTQIDLWKRDIKFNLTIIIWKSWLMMNEVTLSYNNLQILTYFNTSWKEILSDEVQLLTTWRPLPITTRRERKRNFWDLRIGSEVESSSRSRLKGAEAGYGNTTFTNVWKSNIKRKRSTVLHYTVKRMGLFEYVYFFGNSGLYNVNK